MTKDKSLRVGRTILTNITSIGLLSIIYAITKIIVTNYCQSPKTMLYSAW